MAAEREQPRASTSFASDNNTRLGQWFALCFFSSIALVALCTRYDKDFANERAVVKWALSVICIAVGMAGLAVLATLAVPDKFTGTKVEGGMSLVALAFLAAGLPCIMNVSKRLAVRRDGSIRDGNLYFFSWIALFCALLVFLSYLAENHSSSAAFPSMRNFCSWPFLCVTSFVVMASALDLMNENKYCDFDDDENDNGGQDDTSEFCKRTKFAVSLGAICGLFSLIWTFVASRLPQIIDQIFMIFVALPWATAVALLTFGGSKAPGHEVGNLFFFTWASFGIAMVMAMGALSGLMANSGNSGSSSAPAAPKKTRDVESS